MIVIKCVVFSMLTILIVIHFKKKQGQGNPAILIENIIFPVKFILCHHFSGLTYFPYLLQVDEFLDFTCFHT